MTSEGGLHESRRFTGLLGSRHNEVPISFLAKVDNRGEVVLELDEIPLNDGTKFIMIDWDDVPYFRLAGASADGTSFATEHLYFSSIGPHSDAGRGAYFVFRARCAAATFRCASAEADECPMLLLWLKGFECFRQLTATCPTGKVIMEGDDRTGDADRLSGLLAVKAEEIPEDVAAWRADAEKLLEYVRGVMSFAAGTNLGVPAAEFRNGLDVEVTVTSRSEQRRADMPCSHPLDRQGIFETAVRSFHSPPVAVKNLWMALEWFSMSATYDEVRLLNAMTALENLLNSNVRDNALLLQDAVFKKLTKAIRTVIKQFIEDERLDKVHPELLCELAGNLHGLQRRSLKRKLRVLLERWRVPMDGLDAKMISAAINARNDVVHQGRYYHEEGKPQKTDLWVHVTVVRELITRIVLTALGFRGRYVSHLGGYQHTMFPPGCDPARAERSSLAGGNPCA